MRVSHDQIIASTTDWVERIVIGLQLCPFAQKVHAGNLIRYVVSDCIDADALMNHLRGELLFLSEANPDVLESTLLIHPTVLTEFLDYVPFLDQCDRTIESMQLDGVIQVASFHPRYQFAGTTPDDVTNYSNRSPFPTLHLLRESSVTEAVAAHRDTQQIYERNIVTLRSLGKEKMDALLGHS